MHNCSTRAWALLPLVLATSIACGPERPDWPSDPPPDPECVVDADCAASPAACNEAACMNGECVLEPTASGVPCDDGLFCTEGEVCDGHGVCGAGTSPCRELVPGLPRCNEAERQCEVCSDGRPLVNGECRCPFWNCLSRGGATYCSETDVSKEDETACYYDGVTVDDLPPLLAPRSQ